MTSSRYFRPLQMVAAIGRMASMFYFSVTHVRPLSYTPQLLRAVYGHYLGLSEDLSARNLRIKMHNQWYPVVLSAHTSIHLVFQVLRERVYEPLTSLPDRPLVILDCGANIGIASLYFADRYHNAVVHAFEPDIDNFQSLMANTHGLGQRVTLNQAAVSESNGYGELFLGKQTELHSLLPEMLQADEKSSEMVKLVALKSYLDDNKISHVDLLKLDIEGAELDALKGLQENIKDVGLIVGELHLTVVDEEEFRLFLTKNGFTFKVRGRPTGYIVMFEAENVSSQSGMGY